MVYAGIRKGDRNRLYDAVLAILDVIADRECKPGWNSEEEILAAEAAATALRAFVETCEVGDVFLGMTSPDDWCIMARASGVVVDGDAP